MHTQLHDLNAHPRKAFRGKPFWELFLMTSHSKTITHNNNNYYLHPKRQESHQVIVVDNSPHHCTNKLITDLTHSISHGNKGVTHPTPCGSFSTDVRKHFVIAWIRSTKWNFFNGLINHQWLKQIKQGQWLVPQV